MNKYAIIIKTDYLDPADYRIDFTGHDVTTFLGVNTFEQAEANVRQLAAEGYTAFNLCSAFDRDMTQHLARVAGPACTFSYVTFTGREAEKDKSVVENGGKLGFIIFDEGVGQIRRFELAGGMHTSIRFVDSLVMACRAARELLIEGATFIETCSWFDDQKTNVLIATTASDTVPIGTAGRNLIRCE